MVVVAEEDKIVELALGVIDLVELWLCSGADGEAIGDDFAGEADGATVSG